MKKNVFALQVIGLITMIPVYVFLEINHAFPKLPLVNGHSVFIEKEEKATMDITIDPVDENDFSITAVIINHFINNSIMNLKKIKNNL